MISLQWGRGIDAAEMQHTLVHIYPGEHAAILAGDEWKRVQSLIPQPALARGRLRSQHQALLSGLLHCECCAAPMVYSYAAKGDRKYPYYERRSGRRPGSALRPNHRVMW